MNIHARNIHSTVTVFHTKNYDEKRYLKPKDVKYDPNDPRFMPGPRPQDEPYVKLTEEEMVEINRVKTEREYTDQSYTTVDPNSAPFNQVFVGQDDGGKFTATEIIP